MVHDRGTNSYRGYLRQEYVTVAEVMKCGGYRTLMAGKWHVGGEYPPHDPQHWKKHAGDDVHPIPVQRGFDEHYGTLGGAGSYYDPPALIRNNDLIFETPDDYYYTDAINDEACRMIDDAVDNNENFFLYVAHLAPHWPLHAPSDVVDKYRDVYREGWDIIRERRYDKLMDLGLIDRNWECSPRHELIPAWTDVEHKEWETDRMAVYAAQIEVMDDGIGRIVQKLKNRGIFDDTMIIFLSDNGGCAEFLREDGEEGGFPEFYSTVSSDGTQTIVGNDVNRSPGGKETFMSYGLPWSNVSNAPFRLFKSWVHEGGISTPFFVHWPAVASSTADDDPRGEIHREPWIMMDIAATVYDACGIKYPKSKDGKLTPSLEGISFLPVLLGDNSTTRGKPIFWEHQGNRAVRDGKWKLVNRFSVQWELFDMETDRTEMHDLAEQESERVERMSDMWKEWAEQVGVLSWPIDKGEEEYSHRPWDW